ncbi:hypothetical protein [Streptomyces aidingensis]|uniref:Uncharacterized protein n=1 Tax=Streptomyces aidingensis TaxID=910347 RepID=A0A1I1R1I8_9ACTN|nr:hypothetical protein [Streptomyces aidingensis]SFD28175.1 hypothetical protein SAMN05421773_112129 [Streptomyces aidingensis]
MRTETTTPRPSRPPAPGGDVLARRGERLDGHHTPEEAPLAAATATTTTEEQR